MANVPSINYKNQARVHAIYIEPLPTNPSTNAHPHTFTAVLPPTPATTTTGLIYGTPYDHYDLITHEFVRHICFVCRGEIKEESAIYMYKDLSYCSEKCRAVNIDKDDEEEKNCKKAEEDENHKKRNTNKRSHENPFFPTEYNEFGFLQRP